MTKHLQWDTHRESSQTKELVEEMIELHKQKTKYFWLAVSPTDDRVIGLGSIKPDKETAWLGFLVCHQEQRKGFGSAILEALEVPAFNAFEKICAAVDSQNQSSRRLLENSGWTEEESLTLGTLKTYEKFKAKLRHSTPDRARVFG